MKRLFLLTFQLNILFCMTAFSLDKDSIGSGANDSIVSKFKIDPGIDFVNNFIWRGVPLDPGPCMQPALILGYGNVELAILGSYSFKYDFNNILSILSYNINTPLGTLTPKVLDYYYPYDRVKFTEFKDDTTSFTHTVEAGVGFVGKNIPLRIYTCVNVQNDPDNSSYLELGYSFYTRGVKVEPFAGFAFNQSSAWQGATKTGLLNLGISAEKKVKVTESFTLPITGLLSYHSQLDMLNISVRLSIF